MDQQRDTEVREANENRGLARGTTSQAAENLKPSSGGMELALSAGLAVALGYWLDGLFGIRPVLTLVLFFWAVLSLGAILYFRYRADMERLEAGQVWNLQPEATSPADQAPSPSTEPVGPVDLNRDLA